MLTEILTLNIFGFLLVFARVGSAMMLFPGFSVSFVPIQTRLMFALAVSFVMTPALAPFLPGLPSSVAKFGLLVIGEIFIGLFFGFLTRVMIASLQTAGTFIAYFSGMANAFIQDPIAEQQSSVFSSFLSMLGLLVIFITNTHYLMIRAIYDSYSLFTPGALLPFGDFSNFLTREVGESFKIGLQLSSPLLVSGIAYYIGLGLISRLMPQLPVFFFGLPIQVTLQISVLMASLATIMMVFISYFEKGLFSFLAP
jgi:flagellar biosynthetic protein FliR